MASTKHLLVVGGPTASGKTDWAIRLARHFGAGIISADSRQFYREMAIGTARPSVEELARAPHHFVGFLSIHDEYSVGDFERQALARLDELFGRHDIAVLTGGSGLYIKALCEGLDVFPEVSPQDRRAVELLYEQHGLAALQDELRRVDPAYFAEVDTRNPARLIRALSVWRASGQPFSSFRRQRPAPRPFTPVYLQLHHERDALYERIDRRVDAMMAAGLADEARRLYPFRSATALQTVGYQELFDHFDGKTSLQEAVRLIKRNSRHYAKRQLTWMRRDGHWKHIGAGEWDLALRYIDLVRRQDLRIQRRPGDDRGLKTFLPTPLPHAAVCLQRDGEIAAALPVFSFGSFDFLNAEKILTEYNNFSIEEILWHEAILASEDRTVYARPPARLQTFLLEKGFHLTGEAPPRLRALAETAAGGESRSLMGREGKKKQRHNDQYDS